MTAPNSHPSSNEIAPSHDLDLDAETVQDLELDEGSADMVRGGPGTSGYSACRAG